MKRNEYFKRARELYDSGEIDGDTYDAMWMNADQFCNDEDGMEEITHEEFAEDYSGVRI